MPQFESEGSTSQSRQAAQAGSCDMDTSSAEADAPPVGGTDSQSKTETSGLPDLKSVKGTSIKYSNIPKHRYPPGAKPAEISKYSIDSSYAFRVLTEERYGKDIGMVLGEVQFAFICFLLGQNYESFEQWKKLVHLMCTSEEEIIRSPTTYTSFISLLHFHIKEIPSDFFVDIVTSNNFLVSTLHELFQNLESDGVDKALQKKGVGFRKHLTDKFQWDFTSEPDEFAPVVVDI